MPTVIAKFRSFAFLGEKTAGSRMGLGLAEIPLSPTQKIFNGMFGRPSFYGGTKD